ncbi:hypothetical protein L7F22_047970 [Adiantum nelumboides]|nr:hypothetical protein [Adiantum nelumboides]
MEGSNTTATVASIVAVAVAVLLWAASRANQWWYAAATAVPVGLRLPPGSMGWPFIGNMLYFVRHFNRDPEAYFRHQFLSRSEGSDNEIYKAHLFGSPCIVTCSPDMNKFVLGSQMDGIGFTSGWPSVDVIGPSCMVAVEGIQHKRMRRLITEAVSHPLALRKALLRLEKRISNTLAQWAKDKDIILKDRLKEVTFEDICDAFLSISSGPLLKRMMHLTEGVVGGVRAYPINVPGFSYYNALKSRKSLIEIMTSIIESRRSAGTKAEDEDFLDVLLKTKDEEGNHLTHAEICDNIVSFLLAGHESTSVFVLWTMIFLNKSPKVLSKLKLEHETLKSESNGAWFENLKKTPYTDYVLNEVLRIVSISPIVFRTVAGDGVNYKGYYFPKGWKVVAWLRASHWNPTLFMDPYTFNPERFLEQPPKLGQYMPFGHGPRLCPGNMLALLSARMFVHILVTKYKWKLVNPNAKVAYLPHPKPVDGGKVVFELL